MIPCRKADDPSFPTVPVAAPPPEAVKDEKDRIVADALEFMSAACLTAVSPL